MSEASEAVGDITPPTTPLQGTPSSRFLNPVETTPVGDRDKAPKIQLCVELRMKAITSTRKSGDKLGLVLEVAVMYVKNVPRNKLIKGKRVDIPTFVKIRLSPGDIIHSTELKMDKRNEEKVDFIEVFDFPLQSEEDVKGKTMNILVCDRKMTRNATIFGQTDIDVGEICLGKPVCKWHYLTKQ